MTGDLFFRKCLRIPAVRSPNVRLALAEMAAGKVPSGKQLVPGIISWSNYCERLATLHESRQKVVLRAEWDESAGQRLIPDEWMEAAAVFDEWLAKQKVKRDLARYMGVDSGEGGDVSCWCVGDRLGVLDLLSMKTPNTNDVYATSLEMMRRWSVPPENAVFDLGGGGREHADRLRADGYAVRGIGFGRPPAQDVKKMGVAAMYEERLDASEDSAAYPDRRSEMAYDIRLILERGPPPAFDYMAGKFPAGNGAPGFGLPRELCGELVRQMSVVPLLWDGKGRFKLIPKQNENDPDDPETFRALIGRSPDQFDALCCMVFGMTHKPRRRVAGAGR